MSPLLHSDVFSFSFFFCYMWQNKWNSQKSAFTPKIHQSVIPSVTSVIPCKECDASTSLNYSLPYVWFCNSACNTRRMGHWEIQQVCTFQCCLLGLNPLLCKSVGQLRLPNVQCTSSPCVFSLHLTLCTWELARKRTWPVNTMLGSAVQWYTIVYIKLLSSLVFANILLYHSFD